MAPRNISVPKQTTLHRRGITNKKLDMPPRCWDRQVNSYRPNTRLRHALLRLTAGKNAAGCGGLAELWFRHACNGCPSGPCPVLTTGNGLAHKRVGARCALQTVYHSWCCPEGSYYNQHYLAQHPTYARRRYHTDACAQSVAHLVPKQDSQADRTLA